MDVPVLDYVRSREYEAKLNERRKFQSDLHITSYFINRLGLETELKQHTGCVNCLEWNSSGSLLASGSDDMKAIIWDPFSRRMVHSIDTHHHGNIFSVKFLPQSNDEMVITAAGDFKIRVHNIPKQEKVHSFICHPGRVKRLATDPNQKSVFFSAGEDGTIRQFDLRVKHTCTEECNNVVVDLNSFIGQTAEAKCVALNPQRPEQMAVGASDPYVRLYDVRMMTQHSAIVAPELRTDDEDNPPTDRRNSNSDFSQNSSSQSIPLNSMSYYIAGHLPVNGHDYRRRHRMLVCTYVTFSPDGTELLVNLGGEQIYLFDLTSNTPAKCVDGDYVLASSMSRHKDVEERLCCNGSSVRLPTSVPSTNGYSNNRVSKRLTLSNRFSAAKDQLSDVKKIKCMRSQELPAYIDELKETANNVFAKLQYTEAISLYSRALRSAPYSSTLYSNRAASFIKRKWDGDVYAALRDCHSALQLDPSNLKAHFRLAKCLHDLRWSVEALICLEQFKLKFPDQVENDAYSSLCQEVRDDALSDKSQSAASNLSAGNSSSTSQDLHVSFADYICGHPPFSDSPTLSRTERVLRENCTDYKYRFCGHCNTTTDIKEANFFGDNGQYIVAGSDDGSFYIWEKNTTDLVRVIRGDGSIVNCLQSHPTCAILATSGIDPVVRLWSPRPEDGSVDERVVLEAESAASANQKRMKTDPFQVMLLNMGYRLTSQEGSSDDERTVNCSTC